MGHACSILRFPSDTPKSDIQKECDRWANYNCDPYESGLDSGLPYNIKYTLLVFDTQEKADEYLNDSFGDYKETAVKYFDKEGKLWWGIACEVHC